MQISPAFQRISDQTLNRSIRRLTLILIVGTIAFVAIYALDRLRIPSTPMERPSVAL